MSYKLAGSRTLETRVEKMIKKKKDHLNGANPKYSGLFESGPSHKRLLNFYETFPPNSSFDLFNLNDQI